MGRWRDLSRGMGTRMYELAGCPPEAGLLYAMYLVCAVMRTGTVHFAPECKTWLGISTGHAKRKRDDTDGTPSRLDVLHANFMARATSVGVIKRSSGRNALQGHRRHSAGFGSDGGQRA